MKRILLMLLFLAFLVPNVYADRNVSTIKAYTSSELIRTGDAKVYRVTWYATADDGSFGIYDSIGLPLSNSAVKTEGSEADIGNGGFNDFTNKPLEFSTGLYLYIVDMVVVVEYE